MRAVFIGASSLAAVTARLLIDRGHEVVIIERDRERIEAVSEELDSGFLHGDGSKPAILREADPGRTHFLCCLTGNDQANIIAGLVGRSLGFERVVVKIDDPEFEHICIELGLEDTIIPTRTIGRYLADSFQGMDLMELSGIVKDEARLFSFIARKEDQGTFEELRLPDATQVAIIYRDDRFLPVDESGGIRQGDEVVLVTHSRHLADLRQRWEPQLNQHPMT